MKKSKESGYLSFGNHQWGEIRRANREKSWKSGREELGKMATGRTNLNL